MGVALYQKHRSVTDDPVEYIVAHRGGALYHVTDEQNLESISEHGLLSKKEAAHLGVAPAFPGGSELTRILDHEHGLSDYVFLGFSPNTVMPAHREERALRRPVVLTIQAAILYRPDVRIALGRANHAGTEHYPVLEAVINMDRETFVGNFDPSDIRSAAKRHRVSSYEVLVPSRVPPAFIMQYERQ